jgi:hypothetical protein
MSSSELNRHQLKRSPRVYYSTALDNRRNVKQQKNTKAAKRGLQRLKELGLC